MLLAAIGASSSETSTEVVAPGAGLILWVLLVLCILLAGLVTALKGRWGWLVAGLLTGGLAWLLSAFLSAAAGSPWSRLGSRRRRPH